MTEETAQEQQETATPEVPEAPQETSSVDDRFEVKWRKKNEPEPKPAVEATATAGGTEDVATLRRQLEEEKERAKTLHERWQRAAADLANLRRRTEEERSEIEKFSSMLLVQELLPVLDNFERAIATIPGNLAMLTWIQGVMLIERHLLAVLERQGLAQIEVKDRTFTPYEMEAISERETSAVPSGTVLQEYQKGYTMHGRVIRPALVEVAKPVSEPVEESQAEAIADEAENENVGPQSL